MNRPNKNSFLVFGTSMLALCSAELGNAQEVSADLSERNLADIVVTAQKREERLQDVPVAVSALSSATLAKASVDSTLSLQSLVPGLNINNSADGFRPFLRGIGTTTVLPGYENSVSTYVDNIYIASMNGALLNLTSIQSIEVLKGPQGTLFGRNATGGVINVRTKAPSHDLGGNLSVKFDNYEALTATGYLTGGLSEGVAADLAVYYRKQHQGYGINVATGNEHSRDEDFTFRSKILFTPSDSDTITLTGDYSEKNGSGMVTRLWPGTFSQWGGAPDAAHPAPFGTPNTFAGKKWDINSSIDPFIKQWFAGGSLSWEHEFSWATLSSFSAFRKARTRQSWNFTGTPLNLQIAGWDQAERQFSQELQLSSLPSSPIQWIVGGYYLDYWVENDPFYIGGAFLAPIQLQFRMKQEIKSPAIYGQFTAPIEALGETNVTGGLRYTIDKRSIVGRTEIVPQGPVVRPVNDPNVVVLDLTDASKTFKTFTWRLGIDHHFTPDNMVYLTYNRGFKAGAYNSVPPGGPGALPTNPETLDAYEVGLKNALFGGKATLNVSAFLYKFSNMQVPIFRGTSAVTVNAAAAEIRGIDVDFNVKATNNLRLVLSAEFLDHKFSDYRNAPLLSLLPESSGGGIEQTTGDATGNRLPYTSDAVINGGLFYEVSTPVGNLDANVNATWNDGYTFEPSELVRQKSFWDINASFGMTLKNKTTRISVFGKNIANEAVAQNLISNLNPGGSLTVSYRPPRTYGISLSQDF